jgi:hypothetical protein
MDKQNDLLMNGMDEKEYRLKGELRKLVNRRIDHIGSV